MQAIIADHTHKVDKIPRIMSDCQTMLILINILLYQMVSVNFMFSKQLILVDRSKLNKRLSFELQ